MTSGNSAPSPTAASRQRAATSVDRAREAAGAAGARHHVPGPRRSASAEPYRRETRAIAVAALLALAAGVVSDRFAGGFWGRHALLAGLASSVIVVLLSVALVSEAVERRRRRHWRVLAQYVMLELVRNARLVWTVVTELAGLMPADAHTTASMDAGARAVRDTAGLAEAIRELVADSDRRRLLHEKITRFASHSDDLLGRWAAVMLNADAYADVVDRHVELAVDIAGLGSLLDYFEPTDGDSARRRKSQSDAAIQIQGKFDDDWLTDTVVAITQLAEELDRQTLELALRIVPVEWWAARLRDTSLERPSQGTGRLPTARES
jgi:hypothetical protein